jgi:hypothetical protein
MKYILSLMLAFIFIANHADAQFVRVRLGFPAGVAVAAPGAAPFAGGIWIGPEWRWQGGRYVHVPGYWARPQRRGLVWVPGHWQYTRRGYVWRGGRWR